MPDDIDAKMASKQTYFQALWLNDIRFKSWLAEDPHDKKVARRTLCKKNINLLNMGISRLQLHMKEGTKHDNLAKEKIQQMQGASTPITAFFKKGSTATSTQSSLASTDVQPVSETDALSSESAAITPQQSSGSLSKYVTREEVTKAEILWAMKKVDANFSFNSCDGLGTLLAKMFPDSSIAQKFSMQRTKCSYLICHGLAPYFKDILLKKVMESPSFVVLYDETLNRVTKDEQMDLMIRFWVGSLVQTRYWESQFLGHATAKDLLEKFNEGTENLPYGKMSQVGMDGPNVTKKMYKDLVAERKGDADRPDLLDLGTCGLHTVHNALQCGEKATDWNLDKTLKAFWRLFHETPARRADFVALTGCTEFPPEWCAHRWVDNVRVIEKNLKLLSHVEVFVSSFAEKKAPNTVSFATVKAACKDPLYEEKLKFFLSVANQLKPFLTRFQTDAPMIPFLAVELEKVLRSLCQRFMKGNVLREAGVLRKLLKLDFSKKENLLSHRDVDVGFGAKASLRKVKVSELQTLDFQKKCIAFLAGTAAKIVEKSPVQHHLVRQLASLDPNIMAEEGEAASKMFGNVLSALQEAKWFDDVSCDTAKQQFGALCTSEHKTLDKFDWENDRLDSFFYELLHGRDCYSKLWRVVQLCLVFSHGQAGIERGFNQNKEMLETNMGKDTLIALRLVQESVREEGGPVGVNVTPGMLVSCRAARLRYDHYLQSNKEKAESEEKRKRKADFDSEIETLQQKKKRLETDVKGFEAEALKLSLKAENTGNLHFLSKSNALRQSAQEKKKKILEFEQGIKDVRDRSFLQ